MIIGYDFFGFADESTNGAIFDTPVAVDGIERLQLNEGTYDEVYINVDTNSTTENTDKPSFWTITTIIDAKFQGNVDAGSIGADGFNVTKIQLYRSVYGSDKWEAIGEFDYTPDYNLYDYVDRYTQNGTKYQYAIVPVANEVIGEMLKSDIVEASFDGIFLTDRYENRKLEYDVEFGDMSYNTNSSVNQPINGQYPIVTFGNSKYRSGNVSALILSRETIESDGNVVNSLAEQINRDKWMDFLTNGRAKVLRMDNGLIMLIVVQNPSITHKEISELANVSFDYVEIGKLNFEMLVKNNLIPSGYGRKITYDDFGGVVSE